jgi:hypothetical protein
MAKKKRRSRRPETLTRTIAITAVNARVSLSPSSDRDPEPEFDSYASIELIGTMDEPIRDTCDVELTLYSAREEPVRVGKDPVPWIGLIHYFRPVVRPSVFVPQRAFDRLWLLAGAGMAKFAHITLTKPHYLHAYVVNLSLSTHPEE